METKIIEIKDASTQIIVLATRMMSTDATEDKLLSSRGYKGGSSIVVTEVCGLETQTSPFSWSEALRATMKPAHNMIKKHFDSLQSGDVIDVENDLVIPISSTKPKYTVYLRPNGSILKQSTNLKDLIDWATEGIKETDGSEQATIANLYTRLSMSNSSDPIYDFFYIDDENENS